MFYGATAEVFLKAKMLRANQTIAEKLLWEKLSNSQLNGIRFKRQHPINQFVADFYCHKAKLVIEIDEDYHNNSKQKELDNFRSQEMNNLGLIVIRFSDFDVFNKMDEVLSKIKSQLY